MAPREPLADHVELAVGGLGAAVALPDPPQLVPDRVAAQQLPVPRVGALGESLGDPSLEPGELLVAGGQDRGGHQDAAQMLHRLAGR